MKLSAFYFVDREISPDISHPFLTSRCPRFSAIILQPGNVKKYFTAGFLLLRAQKQENINCFCGWRGNSWKRDFDRFTDLKKMKLKITRDTFRINKGMIWIKLSYLVLSLGRSLHIVAWGLRILLQCGNRSADPPLKTKSWSKYILTLQKYWNWICPIKKKTQYILNKIKNRPLIKFAR